MATQAADKIDNIYENLAISNSIVCCNDTEAMSYLVDVLQSKSYPLCSVTSFKKDEFTQYPNKMFLALSREFCSKHFQEFFMDEHIDCIVFIGQETFSECLKYLNKYNINYRQFIFTI